MKKTLWLALILLLVCVFAFSACDGGDTPQTPNDTPSGTTDNTTESETDAHVHAFGEWTTVKDATCTVKGEQERSCSCGEKETQSIDATDHTEVIDAAVAATCTTDGKTEGKHCSVCSETLIAQNNIPASHTDGEWVVDTNATCTEDGSKHQVCAVCSTSIKTEKISATGHIEGEWIIDKEASKIEDGLTHTQCIECGYEWEEKIYALGSCGLTYKLNSDGTYMVSGYGACFDEDLVIPQMYQGIAVTKIGNSAFSQCDWIVSVIIPESVTIIGSCAFYNCESLSTITIPDSVKCVDDRAFGDCYDLKYNIYEEACYLGNPTNPYHVLVKGNNRQMSTLVIHDDTVVIAADSFYAKFGVLQSIVIPKGVVFIGETAFWNCKMLTTITFKGTIAEWKAISFGSGWKYNVPATKVTCSDGTVTLS